MSDIDLTRLTDAQLGALKMVGGDLTKLPDAMLEGIRTTLAAAPAEQPTGARAARIVGQFAQGANDAIANTFGMPVDAVNWAARKAGLPSSERPFLGSESIKSGIDYVATLPGRAWDAAVFGSLAPFAESRTSRFEPVGQAERYAGATGAGVGGAASFLGPAVAMAGAARPAISAAGKLLSAAPATQVAAGVAGSNVTEATDNPWLGLAAGMLTPVLAHGAARAVRAAPAGPYSPEAERRALVETARNENIPLSAGKITGSEKLQTMESWLDKTPLPFLGGRLSAVNEEQGRAFNRAALERGGVHAEAATPNALEGGFTRISNNMNRLARNSTLTVDPAFGAALTNIEQEYGQQLLSQMAPGTVRRLQDLQTAATTAGQPGVTAVTIDGRTYQNIRSELSRTSAESADPMVRRAARQMVNALDDMAERSLPADVMGDWREARRQWRNLTTVEEAVQARNNQNTATGNVPPAALASRSQENPDLRDLSRVGNAFVGDKVPNSGTGQRNFISAMFGAPAALWGTGAISPTQAIAGAAIGAAPYAVDVALNNPMTRAWLMSRLRNAGTGPLDMPGLLPTVAAEHAVQETQGRR